MDARSNEDREADRVYEEAIKVCEERWQWARAEALKALTSKRTNENMSMQTTARLVNAYAEIIMTGEAPAAWPGTSW